jgi:hypothetical protein
MPTPYLSSFDFDVLRAEQWAEGRPPFTHEFALRLPPLSKLQDRKNNLGEGGSASAFSGGFASDVATQLKDTFFIRAEIAEADLNLLSYETQEYRKSIIKSEIVDSVEQGSITVTLQESGTYAVLRYLKLWNDLIWNGRDSDDPVKGTVNPPSTYWMDAHLDLLRFQIPYVDAPVVDLPMWVADIKLINIFPQEIGELDMGYSDPDIHNYNVEFSVEDIEIEFKSINDVGGSVPEAPQGFGL